MTTIPHIVLAGPSSCTNNLLAHALKREVGLDVVSYLIHIEADSDDLKEEKKVDCIIFVTDHLGNELAEQIYAHWVEIFGDTPIVWCHSDENENFFGNKEWRSVTWFDLNSLGRRNLFAELVDVIKKIVR